MNPWSTLLRLALIAILVLNGAGAAAASVTMMQAATSPGIAAQADTMQQPSAMRAGMPCHDMAQMTDRAVPADTAMHASDYASRDKSSPAKPDCCKSGSCQCACVHAAQAALPAMLALTLLSPHSEVSHPMRAGHADPALPHLVRPPIG